MALLMLWLCSGGIFAANATEAINLSPPSSVWNSERFPVFRAVLQTDAWFSSPAEYHRLFQPEPLLAFASEARVLGIDLIHFENFASLSRTLPDSLRADSSRADSVRSGEIKLLRWRYNPLPMTAFVRRVPVLYFHMFGPEEDADPLRPAEPIEQYAYQEPDTSRKATVYASPFDSLLAAPTDSTERVKAFRYQLEDSPVPPVIDLPLSPYFIPRVGLTRTVELDSSGQTITISEKIGLYETRPALRLPLSDYKKLRERQSLRDNFQQLISPRTKAFVDPLQDLLGKITKITIAIPGGEGGFFSTLFGPPTVSLQVNGSIDIRASFQNEQSKDPTLATAGARNRTDPNFDQQVQMNITGAIGDKLTILADWNTQRQFDFENQLKLKYTGYTDEIIQSIEAGNVSLALPTSLIGSSQALFGVRANFQIAGLALSVVASQKRGKTETINVASGAQETTANLRAWQYEYNKHFFISNFYATNWEKAYRPDFINLVQTTDPQGRQLDQIEVWITPENATQNPDARQAVALLNYADEVYSDTAFNSPDGFNFPDSNVVEGGLLSSFQTLRTNDSEASLAVLDPLGADRKYVGPFIKLKPEEYQFDAARGFVTISRGIQPNQVIAVAYRYSKPGDTLRIGDFALGNNNKRLILKMIKPQNLTNSNAGAWLLMLKNIYALGGGGIKQEGFNLKMIYEQLGQEQPEIPFLPTDQSDSSRLIKLTGLDRFGVNNTPSVNGVTDNEFDYLRGVTIDELRGAIIFPFLRPFDKPIRTRLAQLGITDTTRINQLVYNEVYDNQPTGNSSASSQTLKDRYIIRVNFRSDVRASYDLGVNVVQGSVRVYANSGLLTEGSDYIVDYQLGQVTIRNEAALKPGANLRIECEKNELAIIAAKSLLGVRAEYVFSDQFRIGGTFLEYSERPLQDKVRVGDEPILNRIYGFDFQYKTQLPFLTKLIDALPLISTKAESEISVRGEFAQVLPSHPGELNTTLDPQGVSYIDDFEGTKQILTLGLTFNQWALATPPDSIGVSKNTLGSVEGDSAISGYRSQLSWFNYDQGSRENLATKEIFPLRQAARSDNQIRTFNLTYFPYRRGAYNFSPDLNATIFDKPQNTWAGIMRRLPTYISDLQGQNVEFIELWVKYERNLADSLINPITDPLNGIAIADSGYLNIDLGTISEDLLPTRTLNTEDGMPLNATQAADTSRFVFGKYGRELRGTAATTYINNQLNREQGGSGTEDVGIDGLPTSEETSFFKPYTDALVAKLDEQIAAAGADDLKRRRLQDARESVLRDPAGDDFFTATESSPDKNYFPYARINGQEGNGGDGQGTRQATNNFPDTEDLDASTNVSRDNSFFQYSVKLSTALYAQAEPTGEFISGGGAGNGGWIQFRIPLRAFKRKVGVIQDFRNITYARVWMSGFQTAARVRLATLDFVGSQWERPVGDSLISLSVINIEENGDRYALPPGIQRARDRRRVDENILANEQSLAIRVVDVKPKQSRAAFRNLSVQQINLNPYKRLRMFLHGGRGNIRYTANGSGTPDYNAQAFIRFGADSLSNYYEYRIPLKPSDSTITVPEDPTQTGAGYQEAQRALWPDENEIDIDLAALAAFKQSKGGDSAFVRALEPSETVAPGTEVAIVGNPTLGSVRFLMIGVRNVGETNEVLTTELWANELRASGYNEEPGWAARADVSLKLADFGSISASVQRQTADFHDIQVRLNQLGGQNNSLSWGVSGNFNLDKLLPTEAQWSIPLLLSHSETVNEPKYSPGQTDITLEAAIARAIDDTLRKGASQEAAKSYGESIRNRSRSITVSEQFSLPTIKKNAPSDFWLTQLTIDRLSMNFNYTIQNARSPSVEFDQRWSWQFGINYGLALPADAKFYVEPLKWLANVPLLGAYKDFRFYYLPQNYTLSLGLARSRNQTKNAGAIDAPFSTSFSSARTLSFGYRITDTFTFNYTSSLSASLNRLVLDIETNTERDNGEIASLFFRDALAFDLGRDQNYTQGITLSWQPKMLEPLSWIPLKFDYSSNYGWSNPSPDRPNLVLGNAAATTGQFRVSTTIQWRNFLERIGLRKDAGWSLGVPSAPSGQNPPGQPSGQSKSPGNAGRGTGAVPPPQPPPVAVLDTAGMSDEEKVVMLRIAEQEKLAAASAPLRQDSTRADSTQSTTESGPSPLLTLGKDLKNIALTFLTFSDITVNFSSNNNITSSGLLGGTGWFNFFPFDQLGSGRSTYAAPGFAYQLGLSDRPGDRVVPVPGQEFSVFPSDGFTQTNGFDVNTGLALADNFRINLRWSSNWSYNRTIDNRPEGVRTVRGVSGSVSKSYISIFRDVESFKKDLQELNGGVLPEDGNALAEGFERGFEPTGLGRFFGRVFGMTKENALILPLPNWQISWTGLEKMFFFEGLTQSVSFDHAYTSTYISSYIVQNADGSRTTNASSINEQFSPLLGLNISWKFGLLTTLRYIRGRSFTLDLSNKSLRQATNSEFSVTAGFRKSGLKIPLSFWPFNGATLENDLDFNFTLSIADNDEQTVQIVGTSSTLPQPIGSTRINFEPRLAYALSTRVNASFFWRYSRILPKAEGSTIFESTRNEVGFNIRILISG